MATTTSRSAHERGTDEPEVAELLIRWRTDGDRDAREQLFERFFPMARRVAGRYRSPFEPQEDLIQVAAVALLGALDRFDPERGVAFPAFAIPTILGELKRHFRSTGWSAHVPRRAQELAQQVDRASRELAGRTGRTPTVTELAEFLEMPVEDVVTGLHAAEAHYSVSLDAPAPGDERKDPQTLGEGMGRADDGFDLVDAKLSLPVAIGRLPHVERSALRMRVDEGLKQSEIAARMGCSQMQVSRLLRRAAERLRSLTDPHLGSETAGATPADDDERQDAGTREASASSPST